VHAAAPSTMRAIYKNQPAAWRCGVLRRVNRSKLKTGVSVTNQLFACSAGTHAVIAALPHSGRVIPLISSPYTIDTGCAGQTQVN